MESTEGKLRVTVGILILIIVVLVAAFVVQRYVVTSKAALPPERAVGGRMDLGQGARGRVTAITTDSITVTSRDGNSRTFSIAASTTITLDGQPGVGADLQKARFAMVSSSDGATASAITAITHRRRRSSGAAPGGQSGGLPGGGEAGAFGGGNRSGAGAGSGAGAENGSGITPDSSGSDQ